MERERRTSLAGVDSAWRQTLLLTALVGIYFLAGKLGLALASLNVSVSVVWPPTGIALAAALLYGVRVWPAILIGAFLVNLTTAGTAATAFGIAIGNTLETVIAARLVNGFAGGVAAFARPQDILRFALVAALATVVSATIGVLCLLAGGLADPSRASLLWLSWWLGDLVGAIVFTPLIVLWACSGTPRPTARRALEALGLAGALAATGWIVFRHPQPATFACLPPLLWAALRFGRRGAVTASLALAAIALWATLHGLGPFVLERLNPSLLFLQAFAGTVTLTALVLAAATRERERIAAELLQSQEALEDRVRDRTAALAEAVRALHRSRSALNDAQRIAHIGSWEWDLLGNQVTWSDELYRIYGLEPGAVEMTYDGYLQRVHPDDREKAGARIRAALDSEDAFEFEERIVRPAGEIRVLQSAGHLVRDEAGLPRRMIGTCLDITRRKEAELELGRRMDALDRSNAELSVLSYAASHDLKEPLRMVAGNVQLIERRLRDIGEPELRRSADFAIEGVRRMDELIADLLEYSTADRRSDGEVDAAKALAEAIDHLGPSIEESGARIDAGPLPWVTAGSARMVQIFQNLVSNAIKYRDAERFPEIRVSARRDGEMWGFEITDNGRGFPPEMAEKIFVLFERLDGGDGIPGTGLGLAICRRIVESQGGRIWAESEPGRGSVFRFTVPPAG